MEHYQGEAGKMGWKLYLDDDLETRHQPENQGYLRAVSSLEAIKLIETFGMPEFMSLDHESC